MRKLVIAVPSRGCRGAGAREMKGLLAQLGHCQKWKSPLELLPQTNILNPTPMPTEVCLWGFVRRCVALLVPMYHLPPTQALQGGGDTRDRSRAQSGFRENLWFCLNQSFKGRSSWGLTVALIKLFYRQDSKKEGTTVLFSQSQQSMSLYLGWHVVLYCQSLCSWRLILSVMICLWFVI